MNLTANHAKIWAKCTFVGVASLVLLASVYAQAAPATGTAAAALLPRAGAVAKILASGNPSGNAQRSRKKASTTHVGKTQTAKRQTAKKPAAQGAAYATRPEAMAWAADVAERRGLDPVWVNGAIGQAHFVPMAQKFMTPAAKTFQKNWGIYKSRFIDATRINAGVAFWQRNEAALQRAQDEFGVPPSIVVGIIGVETIFGRDMGSFRVIDALATLAFDFPVSHKRAAERQQFFKDELEQFLSLKSRSGLDPLAFKGSYAGAMGLPQFMPSSWIRHALDFDGDGKIDLFTSEADAIGSVAQYFKNHGWVAGQATHFEARFAPEQKPDDRADLLAPDILPSFSAKALADKGMLLDEAAQNHPGPLALV